jgi:putative acetyltransferase
MTITVRPETTGDAGVLRELITLAFGTERVARLVDLIRESPNYVPELSLVAEADGRMLGHIMFSYVELARPDRPTSRVPLLSPLSVHPDAQGQGVGGALVRTGLRLANERGEPLVIVEGIPSLYPRFGFEPASGYGILRPSERIPESAFMVKPLDRYEPGLTGTVRYPAAFWQTNSVGIDP